MSTHPLWEVLVVLVTLYVASCFLAAFSVNLGKAAAVGLYHWSVRRLRLWRRDHRDSHDFKLWASEFVKETNESRDDG